MAPAARLRCARPARTGSFAGLPNSSPATKRALGPSGRRCQRRRPDAFRSRHL